MELTTFGSPADGEPLDQPFRVGFDDDLSKMLDWWRTFLGFEVDVGVDLLESSDCCANLDLAAAEVLSVDQEGLLPDSVWSGWRLSRFLLTRDLGLCLFSKRLAKGITPRRFVLDMLAVCV